MRRRAIALAVLATALAYPAGAVASRECAQINVKGGDWTIKTSHVGCGFARKWTKAKLKSNAEPDGWRCHYAFTDRAGGGKCTRRTSGAEFAFRRA